MTFEGYLSWTHRSESVDHSEPVSSAWCDCEDFEWGVGHKSSVGVSELTLAVDEDVVGILSGVDGQTTWVSFSGVFVEPIAQYHDVCCQIEVVQVAVGVFGWWLSYDNASE